GLAYTYVDGIQVNVQSTRFGLNPPTTIDTSDLSLTAPSGPYNTNVGQDGTGTYTDGGGVGITNALIDDVGIWRRAVTPEEAVAIYNAGNAGMDLQQVVVVVGTTLGPVQIGRVGGNVQFSWNGGPGIRLQKSTTLNAGSWNDVPGTLGSSSHSE